MAKRRRRASGARKTLVVVLVAVVAVALVLYLTKGGGKVENENLGQIEINEVMSSNKGSVPDETGDFPDWIEIYNNTRLQYGHLRLRAHGRADLRREVDVSRGLSFAAARVSCCILQRRPHARKTPHTRSSSPLRTM